MPGNFLGQGTYGQVFERDGKAVKTFSDFSSLAQEYSALRYLQSCPYVVNVGRASASRKTIEMELYDCSLDKWLANSKYEKSRDKIDKIVHDLICALDCLYSRGLVHGDLKPGNVLVRLEPFGAVLGDCGFTSVHKYAKIHRTAPGYCDRNLVNDGLHDMYSLAVILFELAGKNVLRKSYSVMRHKMAELREGEIKRALNIIIPSNHWDNERSCVNPCELKSMMYNLSPSSQWSNPYRIDNVMIAKYKKEYNAVKSKLDSICKEISIPRPVYVCYALVHYMKRHPSHHQYALMFLYAICYLSGCLFYAKGKEMSKLTHYLESQMGKSIDHLYHFTGCLMGSYSTMCILLQSSVDVKTSMAASVMA